MHDIISLRYRTYAGGEIGIITTAPALVIEIAQNQKGLGVPCLTRSCLDMLSMPTGIHITVVCY